jgi:hypothetical protein
MKHKSILKWSLMVFATVLAFNFGVYAQKIDCSQKTEKDIVMAVYEKIKIKHANQVNHINVRYKDGVLTLEGWATTKSVRKEIEKLAKKTGCVTKVVNDLTIGKSGGCSAGQKECGGICISEKESCSICLVEPLSPGCSGSTEQKKPD